MKRLSLFVVAPAAAMYLAFLAACTSAQVATLQTYCANVAATGPSIVAALDQFGVPVLVTNQIGTDATAVCKIINSLPVATPAAPAVVTTVNVPNVTSTPVGPAIAVPTTPATPAVVAPATPAVVAPAASTTPAIPAVVVPATPAPSTTSTAPAATK